MDLLFLRKDIIAGLSYWIIQQCKVIPTDIYYILRYADKWLAQNEIGTPNVSITDYVFYKAEEKDLYEYLNKMVEAVPAVWKLDSEIDMRALTRNLTNTIVQTQS